MLSKLAIHTSTLLKNPTFSNSFWGVFAQVSQSVFLSLFFVIIAREYPTHEFANYIIANALYQLIIAFSTLGLSQWFIREIPYVTDKVDLTNKFFKIQLILGILFYVINIFFAYLVYDDPAIHFLAIILGINIVFDNLINAIKSINIAMLEQRKTFIILTIESFLKFLVSCFLLIHVFSITILVITLLVIRFLSLNLFLAYGSSDIIHLKSLHKYKIIPQDFKKIIFANWPFIVIGGVAMFNWRISTIIISKALTSTDLANYEISYKLFSIAQILPVIVSSSVYPSLIKFYREKNYAKLKSFYAKFHTYYLLFGLLAYTFIYSFADFLLPFAFGPTYAGNAVYSKQMFLTILIFPTALLQANMLIAMKMEKTDMLFNCIILFVNVTLCIIGLHFMKSLAIVNFSIFIAFVIFRICQDILLFRKKILTFNNIAAFYIISLATVLTTTQLSTLAGPFLTFLFYWAAIAIYYYIKYKFKAGSESKLLPDHNPDLE